MTEIDRSPGYGEHEEEEDEITRDVPDAPENEDSDPFATGEPGNPPMEQDPSAKGGPSSGQNVGSSRNNEQRDAAEVASFLATFGVGPSLLNQCAGDMARMREFLANKISSANRAGPSSSAAGSASASGQPASGNVPVNPVASGAKDVPMSDGNGGSTESDPVAPRPAPL